jgi:hypothetical protein
VGQVDVAQDVHGLAGQERVEVTLAESGVERRVERARAIQASCTVNEPDPGGATGVATPPDPLVAAEGSEVLVTVGNDLTPLA